MRCSQCNNEMNKTEELVELNARQTWFECPICSTIHTTSEHTDNDQKQSFESFSEEGDY